MRRLVLLTYAVTAAAISCHAAAQPVDRSKFTFERTKIGKFELISQTEIEWRDQSPFVRDVSCTGDNQNISFVVDGTGKVARIRIAFLGLPEAGGDRPEITLLGDALWLFVDGERYEYRNIGWPSDRFPNYTYRPASQPEIILPVWRGYQAIRASDRDPFLNASMIYGDIIRARALEWSFKTRNWTQVDRSTPENALPKGWQTRRYPIDGLNLKAAVDWCARSVGSEAARHLPAQLFEANPR